MAILHTIGTVASTHVQIVLFWPKSAQDTVWVVSGRKITDEDRARGARVAKLREALGFASQQELLRDNARRVAAKELADDLALERIEYQRVETGESRLTSPQMQRKLGAAFQRDPLVIVSYARGDRELEAIVATVDGGASPISNATASNRVVAVDDEHEHRPAALALMRGKFDDEVIESLRLTKTKADHVLTVDDWWTEARRLQAMRDGRVAGEDIEPSSAPDVSLDNLRKLAERPPRKRVK